MVCVVPAHENTAMYLARGAPVMCRFCTPLGMSSALSVALHTKQALFFTGHVCPHPLHCVVFPGRSSSCFSATSLARGGSWSGASGKLKAASSPKTTRAAASYIFAASSAVGKVPSICCWFPRHVTKMDALHACSLFFWMPR